MSSFGYWDIRKQVSEGGKSACTLGTALFLPLEPGYPYVNKPQLVCWVRRHMAQASLLPSDGQPTTTQVGEPISDWPASS